MTNSGDRCAAEVQPGFRVESPGAVGAGVALEGLELWVADVRTARFKASATRSSPPESRSITSVHLPLRRVSPLGLGSGRRYRSFRLTSHERHRRPERLMTVVVRWPRKVEVVVRDSPGRTAATNQRRQHDGRHRCGADAARYVHESILTPDKLALHPRLAACSAARCRTSKPRRPAANRGLPGCARQHHLPAGTTLISPSSAISPISAAPWHSGIWTSGRSAEGEAAELTWTQFGVRMRAIAARIQQTVAKTERVAILAPRDSTTSPRSTPRPRPEPLRFPCSLLELPGHAERL